MPRPAARAGGSDEGCVTMHKFKHPGCRRRFHRLWLALVRGALLANAAAAGEPAAPGDAAPWVPQRPEFEAEAARLEASGPPLYFTARLIPALQKLLARPDLSDAKRISHGERLAWVYLSEGQVDQAVACIEEVFAVIRARGLQPTAADWRVRGLVYLRQAEVENCIARHNASCCIFPLEGAGVHALKEPARRARDSYLAALQLEPGDLRLRWLLNLTAMAAGDPEGVPEAQRIDLSIFDSQADIGRFPDIAPALGVDTVNRCGGAIVEDFDGDGYLDIVTSTLDPLGPMTFYHNAGQAGFQDRSAGARLDDQLGGLNCIPADYDNDGDLDLLVLRGAWWYDAGRIRNSLLTNAGDGTFVDSTRRAGLADPAAPTQSAAWADFDNDGDLDLYVGNESRREFPEDSASYPGQLFRNNGDGTFSDIAAAAGVTNDRYCKGVTAGDYDNDGDMDLYVSNIGRNRLYRNNADGTFSDVAPELGVTSPDGRSFATWFFDYDNDGWLDLFVAAYDATLSDVAADYLKQPYAASPPCLYRNNGDGSFRDVAAAVGLKHAYLPMGANFGDLDNDGFLDIYLTTGEPDYGALMPNIMLRNDAGRRFQDVTRSGGFGHLQKGHGVAFADLDNDGDQDIYHQLGGFYRGDVYHNALFLNPGHGGRFLVLRLVGSASNRMAVGARIRVTVRTPGGVREIHRAVGSVSSFGGSPLRQEIGLGDARAIDRLEITWPRSGTRQVFPDVPLDSRIRIVEHHRTYTPLDIAAYDLGQVAGKQSAPEAPKVSP